MVKFDLEGIMKKATVPVSGQTLIRMEMLFLKKIVTPSIYFPHGLRLIIRILSNRSIVNFPTIRIITFVGFHNRAIFPIKFHNAIYC